MSSDQHLHLGKEIKTSKVWLGNWTLSLLVVRQLPPYAVRSLIIKANVFFLRLKMLPYGEIHKLLHLCLQTIKGENLCLDCMNFQLKPNQSLESTAFNHPKVEFYLHVHSCALRQTLQKKIYIVNNILFFLEEIIFRLQKYPTEDLTIGLLNMVCALR